MITANNPFGETDTEPTKEAVGGYFVNVLHHANFRYFTGQYERGKNGTLHLQMYVEFDNPVKFTRLRGMLNGNHVDVCKGTQEQCINYVSKQNTRLVGPWEWGERAKQGKRTDIIEFRDSIRSGYTDQHLMDKHPLLMARFRHFPDDVRAAHYEQRATELYREGVMRTAVVLVGTTGTGKTQYVHETYGEDNVYTLSLGTGTSGSVWFDGYRGQTVLLLDDFYGQLKFDFILRLLDRYKQRVQIKGGHTYLPIRRVYITSNTTQDMWYNKVPDVSRRALERRIEATFTIPQELEALKLYDSARNAVQGEIETD